jgi:hypothetical protein
MDKLKIGLIHATMNSVPPILDAFKERENVDLVSFMDEGLIYELNETNKVTPEMIERLSYLADKAVESKVDGILFTCSSFSPYVPAIAERLPVPVKSSDNSMLDLAVEKSEEIIVITTVKAAGPTTKRMLEEVAGRKRRPVKVDVYHLPEAFQELQNGNGEVHDRMIQERINRLPDAKVIVLAQYSMARAATGITDERVITAPAAAVQGILEEVEKTVQGGTK